ncbi:hypothetical protein BKA81DRAFT_378450 [Phyllosticta paracitricarpa]|uniref:Uncharacterized protein n=1 Tax=Phyllosticta citricarpa TaxID=55181 RepID=A0ABR1LMX9_9PEZI
MDESSTAPAFTHLSLAAIAGVTAPVSWHRLSARAMTCRNVFGSCRRGREKVTGKIESAADTAAAPRPHGSSELGQGESSAWRVFCRGGLRLTEETQRDRTISTSGRISMTVIDNTGEGSREERRRESSNRQQTNLAVRLFHLHLHP